MTAVETVRPPVTGVVTVQEKMSPGRAAALLAKNSENRPLKPHWIATLIQMMRDGRFRLNGSTICVSRSGHLLDGQNRLHAVVESGCTVDMLVVYGLEDDVMPTIDQGIPRSVRDILTILGTSIPNSLTMAATATILTALTPELAHVRRERPLVARYVIDHQDELTPWVNFGVVESSESPLTVVSKNRGSRLQHSVSASPLAALCVHMARNGADPTGLVLFFDGSIRGFSMSTETIQNLTEERMAILQVLNKRLGNGYTLTRPGGGRQTPDLLLEYHIYVSAYNKFIRNQTIALARHTKQSLRWWDDLPTVETAPIS